MVSLELRFGASNLERQENWLKSCLILSLSCLNSSNVFLKSIMLPKTAQFVVGRVFPIDFWGIYCAGHCMTQNGVTVTFTVPSWRIIEVQVAEEGVFI